MGLTLWAYTRPNMMTGHKFTDDVAICWAETIEQAYEIFQQLYSMDALKGFVREVKFNKYGVNILTDY